MPPTIEPLHNNVFVIVDKPKTSQGNILIPDRAQQVEKKGSVAYVGPGKYLDNGAFIPTTLRAGDRVVVPPHIFRQVEVGEQTFLVLTEDEIAAKLND
jgi:chaperonin GroES